MKFTCLRENLNRNLGVVSKAIPLKHSLPILTNVLIETKDGRLLLSGTNLDTAISAYVGASIEEEGSITVPAKHLSEFLSHLSSDTVKVSLKKDILHLAAGDTKSKFNGVSAADYPDLPKGIGDDYIELNPKAFHDAVSQVVFSVAIDDTRPVFSGILINYSDGKLTLVASDGFRLSEKQVELEKEYKDFSTILPAKTLMEIVRIFNSCDENIKMYINSDENLCLFECEDVFVASRIIDGTYPDYKRIIPKKTSVEAAFDTASLHEAVKLTHVFSRIGENVLKMKIDPKGSISISSSSQETGENVTKVEAEVKGGELEIVFNARYMLEFLNSVKAEKLVFYASDSTSPCLIRPVGDDTYLHVMAPMQING